MRGIHLALAVLLAGAPAALAGAATVDKPYAGPVAYTPDTEVRLLADLVVIDKSDRLMTLYSRGKPIAYYRVQLGGVPEGDKVFEGDGRTPEGLYTIDRRNPRSSFYLSVGLSYPNTADMVRAETAGFEPGGNIFIHGQPNTRPQGMAGDWTNGCIAVSNEEIREIWMRVPMGTPVAIQP
ncbi:MAG TPA: L,D-transpeptidase family protein [Thermohalobaculum sp.]|nr:L,D-transpeptidase family protein [Thermohalobaculum sp.]